MNEIIEKVQPSFSAPSQTLNYSRKQTLYLSGDPAHSVFRVSDGLVRITRMTPEGRTLTVRHVMPGDFFGEEAFVNSRREEIAEALTNAQIEAIDPQMINHADLMTITQSLSNQMQRLMDYEYHLQTGDLRQRVSRYLLKLGGTPLATISDEGFVTVSATHELIAEGTASTRESVSKIITELRSDGFIESGYRNIILLKPNELEEIAEGL
ncbi:transcriptional regulator LdrP [soil metagenome]|jgi:CRP-like cAMP-binding protein|nr:cyclic nucleotide-binding domain-containing protein [Deinococcota bacterium]